MVPDGLFEKRSPKALHVARELRVVAVVVIGMSNAHERWPEDTLSTLGDDDLVRAGQVGRESPKSS